MTTDQNNPQIAIVFVAFAVLAGATADAVVKGYGPAIGLLSLLTWRFIVGGGIAAVFMVATKRRLPRGKSLGFHVFRSLIQLAAGFSFFYAILQLGLAEATVLGFTAALMVAPIARLVLGEKMDGVTIALTLIGFVGVLVTLSAEPASSNPDGNRVAGLISLMISAVLYALTLNLMRLHARQEDPLTIAAVTNIVPIFVLVPILFVFGDLAPPTDWWVPVILGMIGLSVWSFMTLGYAKAEAQLLAPLEYTALIWSAAYGMVFFGEFPAWQVYLGALIIISACLAVAVRTHYRARREARAPASGLDEMV